MLIGFTASTFENSVDLLLSKRLEKHCLVWCKSTAGTFHSYQLKSLMEAYARKKNLILTNLKFKLDGEILDPNDTPQMLDLEGGECIDVYGLPQKTTKIEPKTTSRRSSAKIKKNDRN